MVLYTVLDPVFDPVLGPDFKTILDDDRVKGHARMAVTLITGSMPSYCTGGTLYLGTP